MRPGNREKRLGEMLLSRGALTRNHLDSALETQIRGGGRLGAILVDKDFISERALMEALSEQLGVPYVDLSRAEKNPGAASLLPYPIAKRYRALPLKRENRVLRVAMTEPQNAGSVQALEFATGMRIEAHLCSEREIDIAVEQCYGMGEALDRIVRNVTHEARLEDEAASIVLDEGYPGQEEVTEQQKEALESGAPIVRLVNLIFLEAVRKEASDIHFEPTRSGLQVRFRLDGVLRKRMSIPKYLQQPVISRIKIIAGMDITNKRTPQDGGIRLQVEGRRMDLRVSSLPAFFGEKIVIRLLDQSERKIDLALLGMSPEEQGLLEARYRQPQGMILVTGPTGSGKSTTLQCILRDLRSEGTNITTVEDPVEYELEGINQVQIRREAGLSFAGTLRAILRQDPNVIMIGEIRDTETAEVAFRAAMTGHMVLSTLHTNDTVSTITRLQDMGVPRFLIGSALLAVVSQRLTRKICSECREEYVPSPDEIKVFGNHGSPPERLYRGKGCSRCDYTGYRGRVGAFELLTVSPSIRECVARGAAEHAVRELAVGQGMRLIHADGMNKVRGGVTTLEELQSAVPCESADCATGSEPASVEDRKVEETGDRGRQRIVFAEDDPALRETVSLTLETLSCDVYAAADGQEAWELVQRDPPDLILTDIHMPRLDGYGLLKKVRGDLRTAFIPVVFLTSRDRCEDRMKGYLLGGDDYIEKPFDHRELLVRVKRCLSRGAVLGNLPAGPGRTKQTPQVEAHGIER